MHRTTVRLDDHLLRQARRRAADTGRTLTSLIEEGLRLLLGRSAHGKLPLPEPPELPISGEGGTLPGVDLDDTAALYDLMDRER